MGEIKTEKKVLAFKEDIAVTSPLTISKEPHSPNNKQNLISIMEAKEPIIELKKIKNVEKESSIGGRLSMGFTDNSARSLNPYEKDISPKSNFFFLPFLYSVGFIQLIFNISINHFIEI